MLPPLPPSPPLIHAQHLRKAYQGQAVVHDVSFALSEGETLVLLGPSGCGKTTLLRLLNRLAEPDGGSVQVQGQDVRQQRPEVLRRGIGYVIQQVGLLPHLTVAENVAVVPGLLGHDPARTAARTRELLERLHLPPDQYAARYPSQLSGGQQQRVGLARALAADPPIILMDEPFGALDPLTRAAIRHDFRELPELRRKTVVLVTHDVQEAFELADRILLLDAGRMQQLGTPRELLFRPTNDFVRRFFDAERLALQLRVLQLQDLLPYLNEDINSSTATYNESDNDVIDNNTTVQQALERLSAASTGAAASAEAQLALQVPGRPAPVSVTLAGLMAAFGQAVQHLSQP